MKKVFTLIAVTGLLSFGTVNIATAQPSDSVAVAADSAALDSIAQVEAAEAEAAAKAKADEEAALAKAEAESKSVELVQEEPDISQTIKKYFIDGGPMFMSFVLIALILGLALCIERIIYLNLATTNTKKLLESIEAALASGGVEEAKEVCRNTRGPVASIFYQGLERSNEGVEMVEKSIIAYGGVQMGLLEKGLSWIGLFIALAPMLGFMGTVIGMIDTFNVIETKGEAEPAELAGGIKVALLTTVSGLIVAMILQVFYNYIVSKIDGLVNQMEDASISMVDILLKHDMKNK
ncbi:MotA/TolQ/ExbB proton channel family protein [Flavobacteriales bacterium]|jgi:biopolymer transport protein ExbB|nr:MotA/TolQ/ExbB proton channel family protein [Flavobacteriales bacterium]